MTLDFQAIADGLSAAVPFVRTLGLEYVELSPDRALLRMPDRPDLHNHVGGPHAGAIFALGESASGAVVIGTFADQLATVTPLAAAADIVYRAVAMGDVSAEARLDSTREDVLAQLAEGKTAKFTVLITITDDAGTVTAEMTVRWALRPNNR
jgi:uncharacterized protein (TIGR00369 family)